jgi:alanine racemase
MSTPDVDFPDARAWVEVNLAALRANFRTIREVAGRGAALIAMVKANGYGLGAERVVRALEPLEPWGYGVATAEEGAELRSFGIERPVVVFSPLPPAAVGLRRDGWCPRFPCYEAPPRLLLFSRAGFTRGLLDAAAARGDVELIDIERLYAGD